MRKKTRTNLGAQRQTTPATPENKRQIQVTAAHQSFSGPIPHPDILEHYNRIVPRAAERILAMAEEDATHRQQLENDALNFAANETRRGQYFGLTIAMAGLFKSEAERLGVPYRTLLCLALRQFAAQDTSAWS